MHLTKLNLTETLLLASILEKNNAWKSVAGFFLVDAEIHLKRPTAYYLLIHLMDKNITLEDLHYALDILKLEDAAKLICKPEMLHIVRQPYCEETEGCFWDKKGVLRVKAGQRVHLKIEAEGSPKPTFQWFCGNIPVCSEQEYIIPAFNEEEGVFHCTVHQREDYGTVNSVISDDITIKLIDVRQEVPQIFSSDCSGTELEYGEELRLSVTVSAGPQPTFRWWHNAKPLQGFKSNVLRIPQVNEDNKGVYECRVKNRFGENSQKFEIKVKAKRPKPSEKRALLISIEKYKNHKLVTPHNDAKVLKECLEKYGFNCTIMQDLSANSIEEEVRKYFTSLQEDAFVLFFFGGHGIMENQLPYMIGSDADFSSQMNKQHVVVENFVIDEVQQYKPLMVITILDMCQTATDCINFPKISSKKWNSTLFRCYSTSQNRSALEGKNCENSLYMKHLKEALLSEKNSTFHDLINKVSQNVIREHPDKDQRPEVRHVIEHNFKLSDPLQSLT